MLFRIMYFLFVLSLGGLTDLVGEQKPEFSSIDYS